MNDDLDWLAGGQFPCPADNVFLRFPIEISFSEWKWIEGVEKLRDILHANLNHLVCGCGCHSVDILACSLSRHFRACVTRAAIRTGCINGRKYAFGGVCHIEQVKAIFSHDPATLSGWNRLSGCGSRTLYKQVKSANVTNPLEDWQVPPTPLVDQFDRKITFLRVSVTDRCDRRCVYCLVEDKHFLLGEAMEAAVRRKPKGHDFVIERRQAAQSISRHMSVTGG